MRIGFPAIAPDGVLEIWRDEGTKHQLYKSSTDDALLESPTLEGVIHRSCAFYKTLESLLKESSGVFCLRSLQEIHLESKPITVSDVSHTLACHLAARTSTRGSVPSVEEGLFLFSANYSKETGLISEVGTSDEFEACKSDGQCSICKKWQLANDAGASALFLHERDADHLKNQCGISVTLLEDWSRKDNPTEPIVVALGSGQYRKLAENLGLEDTNKGFVARFLQRKRKPGLYMLSILLIILFIVSVVQFICIKEGVLPIGYNPYIYKINYKEDSNVETTMDNNETTPCTPYLTENYGIPGIYKIDSQQKNDSAKSLSRLFISVIPNSMSEGVLTSMPPYDSVFSSSTMRSRLMATYLKEYFAEDRNYTLVSSVAAEMLIARLPVSHDSGEDDFSQYCTKAETYLGYNDENDDFLVVVIDNGTSWSTVTCGSQSNTELHHEVKELRDIASNIGDGILASLRLLKHINHFLGSYFEGGNVSSNLLFNPVDYDEILKELSTHADPSINQKLTKFLTLLIRIISGEFDGDSNGSHEIDENIRSIMNDIISALPNIRHKTSIAGAGTVILWYVGIMYNLKELNKELNYLMSVSSFLKLSYETIEKYNLQGNGMEGLIISPTFTMSCGYIAELGISNDNCEYHLSHYIKDINTNDAEIIFVHSVHMAAYWLGIGYARNKMSDRDKMPSRLFEALYYATVYLHESLDLQESNSQNSWSSALSMGIWIESIQWAYELMWKNALDCNYAESNGIEYRGLSDSIRPRYYHCSGAVPSCDIANLHRAWKDETEKDSIIIDQIIHSMCNANEHRKHSNTHVKYDKNPRAAIDYKAQIFNNTAIDLLLSLSSRSMIDDGQCKDGDDGKYTAVLRWIDEQSKRRLEISNDQIKAEEIIKQRIFRKDSIRSKPVSYDAMLATDLVASPKILFQHGNRPREECIYSGNNIFALLCFPVLDPIIIALDTIR